MTDRATSTDDAAFWTSAEITRLVSESGNAAETLSNIVRLIQQRFSTDVCSVYLLEPDRSTLVLAATMPGLGGVPGSPAVLLKMGTPRRYRDPAYFRSVAGAVYGGRSRVGGPPPSLAVGRFVRPQNFRRMRIEGDYDRSSAGRFRILCGMGNNSLMAQVHSIENADSGKERPWEAGKFLDRVQDLHLVLPNSRLRPSFAHRAKAATPLPARRTEPLPGFTALGSSHSGDFRQGQDAPKNLHRIGVL